MSLKDLWNKLLAGNTRTPDAAPVEQSTTPPDHSVSPGPGKPPSGPAMPAAAGDKIAGLSHRSAGRRHAEGGIIQNEKDDSQYNARSEMVERVESMFGEFGPVICSFMLTQWMMPGGIGRILSKLELRSRGRDGADLAQVENWILRNGTEAFCKAVGIRLEPIKAGPQPDPPTNQGDPRLVVRELKPASPAADPRRAAMGVGAVNRTTGAQQQGAHTHLQQITVKPINLTPRPNSGVPENAEPGDTQPRPPYIKRAEDGTGGAR
jgi:hypothetical protein